MKPVPSLWKLLLFEVPMTLCAVLAAVFTAILVVLGLVSVLCVPLTKNKAFQAWKAIPDLWQPWWRHWRVWRWSWQVATQPDTPNNMEVLCQRDQEAKEKRAACERRSPIQLELPPIDVADVLAAMLLALDVAYLATMFGIVVLSACGFWAAKIVVTHINTEAPQHVPTITAPITHETTEVERENFDLAPFLTQEEALALRTKAGVNNFLLISERGGVKVSAKWTVNPKDSAWEPSTSVHFVGFVIAGTAATFKDDRGNKLTVNLGQPLYFENYATMVYMVGLDGTLRQARRNAVTKVPISAVRSAAAVNAQLSVLSD